MKKFLLILLALIVVLIAAVVAVPFLLPMDTYKQQIEAQVERATGRKLEIDGPLDISLLPRLAVTAEDVRFANVAGSPRPDMVRLKGLQAELKIWPLLRGSVEVDRFVLVEPQFQLEIDAAGRPNWALGAPEGAAPAQQAEAPQPPGTATGQPGGGMRLPITELKLGDIRIQNGTLALSDARSGTERRIEAINLDVDLPDLQSALGAKGSLVYQGKPVELALAVERPLALLQSGSSPVRLTGKGPDLGLTFEGTVDNAATPHAAGAIDLNVTSIRDLAAWLGAPIAFEGQGLRTFRVSGQVDGVPTRIALNDAKLALDAIEGQGEVTVDLAGQVPQVAGRLDLGAVDLNPYLPPATAGQGAATAVARRRRPRAKPRPPTGRTSRSRCRRSAASTSISRSARRRSRCAICSWIAAGSRCASRARAWASICRRSRSTAARAAAGSIWTSSTVRPASAISSASRACRPCPS